MFACSGKHVMIFTRNNYRARWRSLEFTVLVLNRCENARNRRTEKIRRFCQRGKTLPTASTSVDTLFSLPCNRLKRVRSREHKELTAQRSYRKKERKLDFLSSERTEGKKKMKTKNVNKMCTSAHVSLLVASIMTSNETIKKRRSEKKRIKTAWVIEEADSTRMQNPFVALHFI